MNISETNERERPGIQRQDEVGTVISNNTSETTHETARAAQNSIPTESEHRNRNVRVGGFDERHSHMTHTGQESHSKYEQSNMDITRRQTSLSGLDPHIAPFEPTHTCNVRQDLWRQLKRVQIPVFHGDKRKYQSWKAAFLACIDNAPATAEYKLLQLRQYLSGEALQVIENLGHSATAYEAAKERLEQKYGGPRRQIAAYLEDLDNFKQVRTGNAKDLEKFADLLDIAIINLQEAGQDHELGNGSLYTKLQRKLSESMLPRYHRWVFENNITESVAALRKWVIQEAEFQTIATETMHGLAGKADNPQPAQSMPRGRNQRTFLVNHRKAAVRRKHHVKFAEDGMRFGDAKNLLRKVQRNDGILRNGRSYVSVALVMDISGNSAQKVERVEKTAVKKSTIDCCTSMIGGLNHRRVARRTKPNQNVSTRDNANTVPNQVFSRRIQLILSRRGKSSRALSKSLWWRRAVPGQTS